jgi:hypothetical protein
MVKSTVSKSTGSKATKGFNLNLYKEQIVLGQGKQLQAKILEVESVSIKASQLSRKEPKFKALGDYAAYTFFLSSYEKSKGNILGTTISCYHDLGEIDIFDSERNRIDGAEIIRYSYGLNGTVEFSINGQSFLAHFPNNLPSKEDIENEDDDDKADDLETTRKTILKGSKGEGVPPIDLVLPLPCKAVKLSSLPIARYTFKGLIALDRYSADVYLIQSEEGEEFKIYSCAGLRKLIDTSSEESFKFNLVGVKESEKGYKIPLVVSANCADDDLIDDF